MDRTTVVEKTNEPVTPPPAKRQIREPSHRQNVRPDVDDVARLEHERHKHVMDLLVK